MTTAIKHKPYPKYKLSDVGWMGEIPVDWEVKKVKHFSNAIAGGTPSTDNESYWYEGNIPWIPSGMCQDNIIYKEDAYKFITQKGLEESSTKKIRPESILVALTGATCANIAYLTFEATANQSVIGLEVNKKTYPKFIFYYLLSQRWQILLSQTGGAQAGVNKEDVKNLICTYPPFEKQKSIADFLDRETAKIDGVIGKKQKLIELLKEKRQALITRAVTKGLSSFAKASADRDPKAKMKPSGVDWLGDIPEGWKIKRLKYISNTRVSNVDKKSEDEISVKLCNYVDVYKNEFIDEKIDFMVATATRGQLDAFELKKGDVILTKDSETPDDIGVPSYVSLDDTKDIVCGYHLAISTPNSAILSGKYLFRLLQSSIFRSYFEVHSNGITRFGLDTYSIFNADIPLPSLSEQHVIADFLDRETAKIDGIIKKVEMQIEKLQEYRQALILNAVTGKIKI